MELFPLVRRLTAERPSGIESTASGVQPNESSPTATASELATPESLGGQALRRPLRRTDDALTEPALIAAATEGDQDAFGLLVARHQDRLYGSLVRITGSPEDAQDVAQEAFVQAYTKLASFAGRSAFYTWLYRIAMNRWISQGRKRRERTSLDGLRDAGGVDPIDAGPAPDAAMAADERATLVRCAVDRLGDEHREVIVLREMDGLDYGQIAEVLGVPVGTVRSRLFRARLQLKEMLAGVLDCTSDTTD